MIRYLALRALWAIPTVLGIVVVGFILTRVLPGDPAQILVGDFPAPPGYVEEIRERFGLDGTIAEQFTAYIRGLLRGDLGFSFFHNQPVSDIVVERSINTLVLMVPSLILASIVGVLLGSAAAKRMGTIWDTLITSFSISGRSIPVFWLAIILILIFAVNLGWLPSGGMYSIGAPPGGMDRFVDLLKHMVLPVATLTLAYTTVVARVSRGAMIEASHQEFVDTALAKGLSESRVHWRHVFRNSLVPVVTVIGFNFGYALTGAVLTETVFSWPGAGSLLITSVTNRDYPIILGVFLFSAVSVVVFNLITDALYVLIDPRMKASHART